MRTLIRVEHANCTHCLNAIEDALMARSLVRAVRLHAADGCIEVDHDHDDPGALVELLQKSLRGWQMAGNGEIVQTPSIPSVAHVCQRDDTRSASTDPGGDAPCASHPLDADVPPPERTDDH